MKEFVVVYDTRLYDSLERCNIESFDTLDEAIYFIKNYLKNYDSEVLRASLFYDKKK